MKFERFLPILIASARSGESPIRLALGLLLNVGIATTSTLLVLTAFTPGAWRRIWGRRP